MPELTRADVVAWVPYAQRSPRGCVRWWGLQRLYKLQSITQIRHLRVRATGADARFNKREAAMQWAVENPDSDGWCDELWPQLKVEA